MDQKSLSFKIVDNVTKWIRLKQVGSIKWIRNLNWRPKRAIKSASLQAIHITIIWSREKYNQIRE